MFIGREAELKFLNVRYETDGRGETLLKKYICIDIAIFRLYSKINKRNL